VRSALGMNDPSRGGSGGAVERGSSSAGKRDRTTNGREKRKENRTTQLSFRKKRKGERSRRPLYRNGHIVLINGDAQGAAGDPEGGRGVKLLRMTVCLGGGRVLRVRQEKVG